VESDGREKDEDPGHSIEVLESRGGATAHGGRPDAISDPDKSM
jgi:hypothetical protein